MPSELSGPSLALARAYTRVGRPDGAIAVLESCVQDGIEVERARVEVLQTIIEYLPLWQSKAPTRVARASSLTVDTDRFMAHNVVLLRAELPADIERRRAHAHDIFLAQYEEHYLYDAEPPIEWMAIDFFLGVRRVDVAVGALEDQRARGVEDSGVVVLRVLSAWVDLHAAIAGDRRDQILASGATEPELEAVLAHDRVRLRAQLSVDLHAPADLGDFVAEHQQHLDRELAELRARLQELTP